MSTKDKLLCRLLTRPRDFTFDEVRLLLSHLGYIEDNKGRTSGSRVSFFHTTKKSIIFMHKPHPSNIVKLYAIDKLIDDLEGYGDI